MPTKIYDTQEIQLIDGTVVEISPLKIKYLKQFMSRFEDMASSSNDDEAVGILVDCTRICMKQFYPLIKTIEDVEDNIDLPTVYKVIEYAAGIKINKKTEEAVKQQGKNVDDSGWENLDLAKLESEVFILGIWKNFDELESSLSMPELIAILELNRELDYNEKKFMAAMQGVDLDEASGIDWNTLGSTRNFTFMFGAKKIAYGTSGNNTGDSYLFQGASNGYDSGWRITESNLGTPGTSFSGNQLYVFGSPSISSRLIVTDTVADRFAICAFTQNGTSAFGFLNGVTATATFGVLS